MKQYLLPSVICGCLLGLTACGDDDQAATPSTTEAQPAPLPFPGAPIPPVDRPVVQAFDAALDAARVASGGFARTIDHQAVTQENGLFVDDENGREARVGKRVPGMHAAAALYVLDFKRPKASDFSGVDLRLTGVWKEGDLDLLVAELNKRYRLTMAESFLAPVSKAGRSFSCVSDTVAVGPASVTSSASVRFASHQVESQVIEVRIIDPRLFPAAKP